MSCLCGKKNNGSFWICCDKCQVWYHGKCVGVNKKSSLHLEEWLCHKCQPLLVLQQQVELSTEAQQQASFTCECSNNQRNARLIICCGNCKKWFDSFCIRLVRDNDSAELFRCPCCRPVDVSVGIVDSEAGKKSCSLSSKAIQVHIQGATSSVASQTSSCEVKEIPTQTDVVVTKPSGTCENSSAPSSQENLWTHGPIPQIENVFKKQKFSRLSLSSKKSDRLGL